MKDRRKIILLAVGLLLLAALLASCGTGDTAPDPLAVYKNQPLEWHACDSGWLESPFDAWAEQLGSRVGCTTMRVPLDYSRPEKGEITVALLRVRGEQPDRRLGVMAFNPGGPGGDGLSLAVIFGTLWSEADSQDPTAALYKELSQHYDLIGFSPRGTGASTRLRCTSDQPLRVVSSLIVDASPENIGNILYNARLQAEACLKNPLTPYINSDATARDMDLMRHLLGEQKLNYLGISYGTWLGRWYASLFPDRVGRMLLIGNTDATAPLNDTLLPMERSMQRVLDEVLAPYAARHPDRFNLGGTADAVRQVSRSLHGYLLDATTTYMDPLLAVSGEADSVLLALRAAQVLQGLVDSHPGENEAEMQARIAVADFFPAPDLNSRARLVAGELNGTYFRRVRGETATVDMQGEEATFWAIQCNDAGSSFDADSWMLESALNAELYPLFGSFNVVNPCLYWGGPAVTRPPLENAIRAGGVVMLQSRLDPLTLLEGTLKSFAAMPNASMILIEDEYQHALGIPYGNECIDRPIAEYLLYGTQPPRMTSCQGNPLAADAPP